MPLSWNEIRDRALGFSKEWATESSESAEAKSFWDAFFLVFGITRRRVASFEEPVKKSDGHGGFIDLLWKGVLLVEHKSRGKDLDAAFLQGTDYFHGLKERDLPRYILVSDFARFRLYDLDEQKRHDFPIELLHKHLRLFGFIAGYESRSFGEQDPVNIEAAERLGKLHDQLKGVGYVGHPLEVFLVRLLFCLFAEDNSIFERQEFRDLIDLRSAEDGADLAPLLANLFQVLNTPPERRLRNLDEQLAAFPYINGRLFEETLPLAAFDRTMRETLLECSTLDWSRISPAIFGALFQSIMNEEARRNLGAHYTTEVNILKALRPLFLDNLRAEFERIKRDVKKLSAFHQSLSQIRILDPACGCGNFLAIAYRELRLLELDVLDEIYKRDFSSRKLEINTIIFVDVDQFYGIEIEEFPAQIAQVALWMTDHQMNLRVSEQFGYYFARLPLTKAPNIVHGNALQIDWRNVVAPEALTYIVGNPPFVGKQLQTDEQKRDLLHIFNRARGSGTLDYVSAWYAKSADYMSSNANVRAALVSTSSITQGEQVGVLWRYLFSKQVRIHFAHRSFQWSSEAAGAAAVHCVIIGFGVRDVAEKWLFEYATPKAQAHAVKANNINPYLVDADDILLEKRRTPIRPAPLIAYGSMANDGGYLLLSDDEKAELVAREPGAAKWIRPFMQVDELLYGSTRWCLWLVDIAPLELKKLKLVSQRVHAVQEYRLESDRPTTKDLAAFPTLFGEIRQPVGDYLVVPCHSGEDRTVIPIAKVSAKVICGNANLLVADASPYVFGVLQSSMHMAWVRGVCGRLESRYRYSAGIVYNNFAWPEPTPQQRTRIEDAAKEVLAARQAFPGETLAALYDPLQTPPMLTRAHQALNRAVDAAYGKRFQSEAERVAHLFGLYQAITSLLPPTGRPAPGAKRARPPVPAS